MKVNTNNDCEPLKPQLRVCSVNAQPFINQVRHKDNRLGMIELPEKCAKLIIADPPYFEVKGDFDFEFQSFDEYLQMMEQQAIAYKRILAENGTLFVFGSSKNIAYVQVIFDKYFCLINNLVWEKAEADGMFGTTGNEGLRSFPNSTERILMYSNEINRTGLEEIKLDIENFKNLRNYFKQLQFFIGLNLKQINSKLGHRKAEHCFYHSSTQWDLPTIETYSQLIKCFKINDWLKYKEYEELRQEYEELRQEYEELRRPFENFTKSTEVLKVRFKPSEYDHPTVKPEKLARLLIKTCSLKGDLVVVPFAGSGTECAMAAKEGRNFIGFEKNLKYVEMSNARIKNVISQPELF